MAASKHSWRSLFGSDDGYARARMLSDAGYLTDEQLTQAIYELDHTGSVITQGLAERADLEGREIEAWEVRS